MVVSCLNGANYHLWADQMIALFCSKGLWMYLEKPLLAEDDDGYDLVCLKKDEALGLITFYVERGLVHHTKGNKSAKQI
jgi:hypothetical protein